MNKLYSALPAKSRGKFTATFSGQTILPGARSKSEIGWVFPTLRDPAIIYQTTSQ
jgi:hypothetical protein